MNDQQGVNISKDTGPAAVPPPPPAPGHQQPGPYGPPVPGAPAGLPGPNAYGAWTPRPGQAPYPYPYPYPGPGGGLLPAPKQNGKGVTAMVLGLTAVTSFYIYGVPGIVLGVLAIVFGTIGMGKVKRGEADNGSQARIGIITGAIGLVLGILALVLTVVLWESIPGDDSGYDDSGRYSFTGTAHTPDR
ncbi:DUF4190 domain-containing protein [Streptomyces sp. NPDC003691]